MTEPELPIFRMSQNYLLRGIWRRWGQTAIVYVTVCINGTETRYLQKRKTEKRGMSDPEIERKPKPVHRYG